MAEQLDQTRALSRLVLSPGWTVAKADSVDPAQIQDALHDLSNPVALRRLEPKLDGDFSRQIENSLRMIGAKIAATINDDQANAWRKAMVVALSDLPARIANHATAKAIHRPFRFLNEVEGVVREIASESIERQGIAKMRLERWLAELARAAMPVPQIAAPIADEPMTFKEIRALTPDLRKMALGQGWLTQSQIDEALDAEEEKEG